jgi:hypothetical protein
MDQNRDWKPIAALILAGLALFVALGGARGYGNDQASAVPQQIIVQPVAPSGGVVAPAPAVPAPVAPAQSGHVWGGWGGGHGFPFFPLFPLLFLAGLIFVVFRVLGHRRYGWGGPGWYGRPWGGPGPGPGPQGPQQGQPYQQYPPQWGQGPGQSQPYSGYPPQGQQPQQGQQGEPSQGGDAHGDITRPEGSGE